MIRKTYHKFTEQLVFAIVMRDAMLCRELVERIIPDRKVREIRFSENPVMDALAKCGICYARTIKSTEQVNFPANWLEWHPTCHHKNPRLMEITKRFVDETPRYGSANWLLYVWGHSFEFDKDDNWDVIKEFTRYAGGKEDIWYATNIEIYDYVKAYESLQTSVDKNIVHNPTATDVWFAHKMKTYCVKAGETLYL